MITAAHDDPELLGMISDCLRSFEEYHRTIFEMEIWLKLYDYNNLHREDYQDKLATLDKSRTIRHATVLDPVNILYRMAVNHSILSIYDGEVSKEHPQ